MRHLILLAAITWGFTAAGAASGGAGSQAAGSPEARAVAYLVAEAPRWHLEPDCSSCDGNGDAVRALAAARGRGYDIATALDSSLAFLRTPAGWDANATRNGDADKPLARLQFASALAAASAAETNPSDALVAAAGLIEADQLADGSWNIGTPDEPGTPATYGTALATVSARATLIAAGREPDHFAVAQIDRWLRTVEVTRLLDASAVVLGLGTDMDVMAMRQRGTSLDFLRSHQAANGGFMPAPGADPDVFDTAVALLGLGQLARDPRLVRAAFGDENLRTARSRAREWLIAEQRADGSWPESNGQPRRESYAERISTTAWALLALLETPPLP